MTIELAPPWRDLIFMSALSEQRADRLIRFLTPVEGTVLDLGCGWAELLLRVIAAAPASTGIGIDMDPLAIRHAQQLAHDRGLADRVDLRTADGKAVALPEAAAVICVGSTHVWAPPATDNDPLHYLSALQRIRALLPRGGRVVYGDGVWSRPPTPQASAALGGSDEEFVPFADLVATAGEAGFAVMASHEASLDEWDEFESGYTAAYARWLAEHSADHPDAATVRGLARDQHDRYLRGYRTYLGLAYLELVAV